jgi:hypothetical protein
MPVDFDPQIAFDQQEQQGYEMCWIAVAVSVDHHFDEDSTLRQCGLAKRLLHIAGSCCTRSGEVRSECDRPGRLEEALQHELVDHLAPGTSANPNPMGGGPMTFADVKEQIDNNLPVCIYIEWDGTEVGHFSVISGYHVSGGTKYLYVNDPLYGSGSQPYNRVVSNYFLDGGSWQFSYLLKA